MNKIFTITFLSLFFASGLMAQTFWTGPTTTFTKLVNADWTLEENQDRITDDHWITRANNKGLFNIAKETEFEGTGAGPAFFGDSPADTEWAFGSISDGVNNLTFTTWIVATTQFTGGEADPTSLLDRDMVLHLITPDIYIDIKLTHWGSGQAGGGSFSYDRSTEGSTSTNDFLAEEDRISIFPNPTTDFIQIKNFTSVVEVIDAKGQLIFKSNNYEGSKIDLSDQPAGLYYVRSGNNSVCSFIKE